MGRSITLSPLALSDLESIHRYVARDSIESAERITEEILKAVEDLSDFPRMGKKLEPNPNRENAARIEVITILHTRRRFP